MSQGGSKNKVANGLVSASCAAVLAVYAAGYARTQSAANRLAAEVSERRAAVPDSARTTIPMAMPGATPGDGPTRAAAVKPRVAESAKSVATAANAPAVAPERFSAEVPAPSPSTPAPVSSPAASSPAASAPDSNARAAAAVPEVKTQFAEPKSEAVPVPPAPVPPAASGWKDGTYTGWGYSRHGNIEAEVVIEGGRIASAIISQCRTRYSCSVIDVLPPQVAKRQSPNVDYVSGATQSADAFYGAVVEALSKAK
jgi:uncharacterized protein with FMN-binding domain